MSGPAEPVPWPPRILTPFGALARCRCKVFLVATLLFHAHVRRNNRVSSGNRLNPYAEDFEFAAK